MSTPYPYRLLGREPKLADRAMQQLQELIINRTFSPGDRLPAERVLGEQLGVSRTVIREALRGLAIKGLVEVRDGAGAFVRSPSTALVTELLGMCVSRLDTGDLTFHHILEMRRILEIEMAGLAAKRHSQEHVLELNRLVALMEQPGSSREQWAEVDYQFHDVVAVASHNPLFPIVLRSISDALMRVRLLAMRLPDFRSKSVYHHRSICTAIRSRSVRRARAAMEAHLREAEHTMSEALALQAPTIATG
jgi:GntR family transcriptional regulator, transcriptional repressor for pyruvate dehydrogenase complex